MPAWTRPWPPGRRGCPGRGCGATGAPWRCTPRPWPASRRSSTCTSPWPGWSPTGRPPPAASTRRPGRGSRPACTVTSRARSRTSGWRCSGGWDGVREVASSAELGAATDAARQRGAGVGFVPTMGALHAGHRALLARARADNGFVVASVFVNPLQFGPAEDLASYPRDREADLAVLAAEGTDLAFVPAEGEVWSAPPEVRLRVGALAKLLHLVGPSRAYFGQKDAQQLAVVRRMVDDLAFPNEIVACPTVREPDGLAVSSRNAYLSAPERRRATALYGALRAGRDAFLARQRDPVAVETAASDLLDGLDGVEPDYLALVDPATFDQVKQAEPGQVLATAARVGRTRLIDNVILRAVSKE